MKIKTTRVFSQWLSAARTASDYWKIYGGWTAAIKSPYLAAAIAITALARPYWNNIDQAWIQNAIDIVPGLLGFSIGAFAVILVFSSVKLIKIISQNGKTNSLLMSTAATFVHFIVCQTMSILIALLAKPFPILNGPGFFMLVYSILIAIAATFSLFGLAQIFNASMATFDAEKDSGNQ